jgi:aconitate hydratase/homoaconitate hydratase
MGPGSLAWLASGATVAASALEMKIADPRPILARIPEDQFRSLLDRSAARPSVTLSEPLADVAEAHGGAAVGAAVTDRGTVIEAKVQVFEDHVDTDAIIPGEFCHLTDPEEIGGKAFHYVRPDFLRRIANEESVIVAGEGWGSGSSREHAVWALKYAGVKAVIAKSYAFIHKRNLVNEAVPYFVLTDPEFHAAATDGTSISIRLEDGAVTVGGRSFKAEPVQGIASRIMASGGIVPAVQKHGAETFDVLTTGAAVG